MASDYEIALELCAEYARLNMLIRSIKSRLGANYDECKGLDGKRSPYNLQKTHLAIAFEPHYRDSDFEEEKYYLNDEQVIEALDGCVHCLAANRLVKERKKYRKALSQVKRRITLIGRRNGIMEGFNG